MLQFISEKCGSQYFINTLSLIHLIIPLSHKASVIDLQCKWFSSESKTDILGNNSSVQRWFFSCLVSLVICF